MDKNSNEYESAKRRVKEIKAFYSNLFSFIFVNVLLIAINLLTSPTRLWFYWVTIFWGIGIFSHAFALFGLNGFLGKDWEDRKVKEIMDKNEKS